MAGKKITEVSKVDNFNATDTIFINSGGSLVQVGLSDLFYKKGDSIAVSYYTAGYITGSGQSLYFTIPLAKPIIGNPTITISGDVILRQDAKYTHGSAAGAPVTPNSWSVVGNTDGNAICIYGSFSDTTNVVNNAPVGIQFSGNITFS